MNPSEQKDFDQLRSQLAEAQNSVKETNAAYATATTLLKEELRLYRGLFWGMLFCALTVAILKLLQR